MPDNPLFSKEDLINALWERSNWSVKEVYDELLALEMLARRARRDLNFLSHSYHIDPDHIPAVEVMLSELNEELNKPTNAELLRWMKMVPPKGELLGFKKRSSS